MSDIEQLISRVPRPEPSEALDRRIATLLRQSDRRPTLRRHRRAWMVGVASVAAACAIWWLSSLRPSQSWAQVAEAIHRQPWIHLKTTDPANATNELWLSFPRDVAASRRRADDAETVSFIDYRTGVKYEYERPAKKLLRLPVSEVDQNSFQSLSGLFRAIFRGDASLGPDFALDWISSEKRQMVEEQGRKWLDYELQLERDGQTATATIRVDPDSKLPAELKLVGRQEAICFVCDYPQDGPADIHAFGVPDGAAVDDRVPPADLARAIRCVDECRRDLDNYFAVVTTDGGHTARLIWRKGDKWRVEMGVLPDDAAKSLTSQQQRLRYWHEHLAQAEPLPLMVCTGRRVYRCRLEENNGRSVPGRWEVVRTVSAGRGHAAADSFGDAGYNLVELVAYPSVAAAPDRTIALDPAGRGGPPGSVLIEETLTSRDPRFDSAYHKTRHWLDPERRFVALKTELSDCPEVDRDPCRVHKADVYELEAFRQSPRGIWYPTQVRRKNAMADKDKHGVTHYVDEVTHYELDFPVQLPDDLFTPAVRK